MNMELDLDSFNGPRQEPTRKFAPNNSKFKPEPKHKEEPLASEPPPLPQDVNYIPSIRKEELDTKLPLIDSTTTKTEFDHLDITSVTDSTVKMDIEATLETETEEPKYDLMEEMVVKIKLFEKSTCTSTLMSILTCRSALYITCL